MATYDVEWTAILVSTTTAISVGQCLTKDSSDFYWLANAANIASYGRSVGIARTVGDVSNRAVQLQTNGICPNSVTGLGAGSVSWVRVSSTGVLERFTPSIGGSSDVVGYARADGSALLWFGLLSETIVSAAGGVVPGAPTNSVQYNSAGTALGGAANVAIAGGDLCIGVGLGTVATTGSIRGAFGSKTIVRSSGNYDAGVDLTVWQTYDLGAPVGARDTLTIGSDAVGTSTSLFERTEMWARSIIDFGLGPGPSYPVEMILEDIGGGRPGQVHIFGGNLVLGSTDSDTGNGTNGIIFLNGVAPSSNPVAGSLALYAASEYLRYIRSDGTIIPLLPPTNGTNISVTNTGTGYRIDYTGSTGPAVPTGTGFWHITAGSSDAASKKVDLTASADITAPATASGVVRVSSSVLTNSANFTEDGSGNATLASSLAIGSTPAVAGLIRVPWQPAPNIISMHTATAGDYPVVACASATLKFGDSTYQLTGNYYGYNVQIISGAGAIDLLPGTGNYGFSSDYTSGWNASALPMIGDTRANSPYGVHAMTQINVSGSFSVAAADYKCAAIEFNGTPGGAFTATFPAPASLAKAYWKWCWNNTNGAATISTGTGTTRTLAVNKGDWFLFSSLGVNVMQASPNTTASSGSP